jgi:predicted DNA-binding transcriptional regulator AlpA
MNMSAQDPLGLEATLTVGDLAHFFRVHRRTIWKWVAEGKLPRPYAVSPRVRRWKPGEIRKLFDDLQKR